jgi:5-methylcytosine-specific restriction endonuclease McrA
VAKRVWGEKERARARELYALNPARKTANNERYRKSAKGIAQAKRKREERLELLRQKRREYVRERPEHYKELKRASYYRHREKVLAKERARRALNPEKDREAHRLRRLTHPERVREIARACRARNREAVRERAKKGAVVRRARLCGVRIKVDKISLRELAELKATFDGKCAYCLCADAEAFDHVEPIARGGAHSLDNLVPACTRCNSSKNARTLMQWLRTPTARRVLAVGGS